MPTTAEAPHPTYVPQTAETGPFAGLTFLVVEDSRFASDAMRLMVHRLGGRMRRADSLRTARAHLRTYRPDVVLVDLGLPDGPGQTLIRDLAVGNRRPKVLLGMSADPSGRAGALSSGAAGFIEKPPGGLAALAFAVLRHLPNRPEAEGAGQPQPAAGWTLQTDPPSPDPLALRDDLRLAVRLAQSAVQADVAMPGDGPQPYLAGFLRGLGRLANDASLTEAASAAELGEMERLTHLLDRRLQASAPFPAPGG